MGRLVAQAYPKRSMKSPGVQWVPAGWDQLFRLENFPGSTNPAWDQLFRLEVFAGITDPGRDQLFRLESSADSADSESSHFLNFSAEAGTNFSV